jgi:ATP/maltotriose-dependent transcriptional regulator MalT
MAITGAALARVDRFILASDRYIGPLPSRTKENARATNGKPELDLVATNSLSSREQSILERIGQGQSNKEIAKELSIAPETVKSHIKNIFIKLAVRKRAQAVARAQGLGLVRSF